MDLGFRITYEDKGKFQIVYSDGSKERSSPTDYLLYTLIQNTPEYSSATLEGIDVGSFSPVEQDSANLEEPSVEPVEPVNDDTDTLIKINSATTAEIDQLPGIGASSAAKIYENKGDGYVDLADLKARSGITHLDDAEWNAIANLIAFD